MRSVGIVGASGYAGGEAMRLVLGHPDLELSWATGASQAGRPIAEVAPHLAPLVGAQELTTWDPALADGVDAVFVALPHGQSQGLASELVDRVKVVIDLGADFRLRDPAVFAEWYGEEHTHPELLERFAYGLPELFRDDVVGTGAVAAPGCYPTSAALALAPFVRASVIEPTGIVVDAASGVSGAGRPPKEHTTFCAADEDLTAYGLLSHRHTPEIEQATGAQVLFTPHLAPMSRGILATCYARPIGELDTGSALAVLADTYAGEPFVHVSDASPHTKATTGSNSCHLTARVDPRTGWLVVLAALDNLGKGAAGQAVQCANLALGIDETAGLSAAGLLP